MLQNREGRKTGILPGAAVETVDSVGPRRSETREVSWGEESSDRERDWIWATCNFYLLNILNFLFETREVSWGEESSNRERDWIWATCNFFLLNIFSNFFETREASWVEESSDTERDWIWAVGILALDFFRYIG